jgi:hypothetical protein
LFGHPVGISGSCKNMGISGFHFHDMRKGVPYFLKVAKNQGTAIARSEHEEPTEK